LTFVSQRFSDRDISRYQRSFGQSFGAVGGGARHPSNTGTTSPFTGDIDEVNLWQRALSPAEVAQLPLQRHICPQANLTVVKSVQAEADPHDAVNAKLIPGATAIYAINVTNSGTGGTDEGMLTIDDTLPADVEFSQETLMATSHRCSL